LLHSLPSLVRRAVGQGCAFEGLGLGQLFVSHFCPYQVGPSQVGLVQLGPAQVIQAVRGTVAGLSFVDPAVAGKLLGEVAGRQTLPSSPLTDKLTPREVDVLRLLTQGLTKTEIADRLYLSEGTVRNHVSLTLSKLDVPGRTQAAVLAIQHGLGGG
jgi:DNA-binding NarL/FixJ family response regulator